MLINVSNEKAKAQAQRAFLRRQQSIVRSFARKLRTVINEQYIAVANVLEHQRTDMGLDIILDRWGIELYRAYSSGYRQTATTFSQLIFDAINNLKLTSPPESKAMQDEFWQAFTQFSHSTMAKRVVGVNNTTKKFIRRTIDRGVKDGKSYGKIAKDLRDRKQNTFNKKRAIRIARTEVHMVSNYSTQEAVKSTRLEMEKEWVAFIDDRTRTDHILANGKRAAMNVDFNVGGAAMAYPGDPKGGAKNVVHCRCVVMYHKVKSAIGGTTQRPTTDAHRPRSKPKPKPTYKPDRATKEAINSYTESDGTFTNINNALRRGKRMDVALTEDVKLLDAHLLNAKKYKGIVYRGIDMPWPYIKTIKPGAIIKDKAFVSTTRSKTAFVESDIRCVIHQGKSGVDIARYSDIKAEKEVLFPRDTKFKVLSVHKTESDRVIINMKEAK